ncbi:MAG: restriction endonuclease subunit S [Bacteroidetes bacterium]|nr:restriction endonuclease subunit S [Bacteroidota bacterium]MBL6944305.1 restriction endonuclease subunit S [Bacteroidales bacterium]
MKGKIIPNRWVIHKLGNVCNIYQPKTISKNNLVPKGQFLVYGANGVIGRFDEFNHVDSEILVTCRGATCGTVNVSEPYSWINGNAMVIQPKIDQLTKPFIRYFFESINLSKVITGSAQPQITRTSISPLDFPIPPVPEQHLIVTKIEELFSELDNAVTNLKKVKAQLKVYRQSVLKWAFEGRLTEEWRKNNKTEPIESFIERISEEKECKYNKQLEVWDDTVNEWEKGGRQGKRPNKPSKISEIQELSKEELSGLEQIPNNWIWVRLGELTWSVKDGPHYSPKYEDEGIPFISGGNVRPEGVNFENTKYISTDLHYELSKRCIPEYGDILYTKGGTTGIARVNTYKIDFNVWVHVAVLKITKSIYPFYLQNVLNSPFCYRQSQKYTHGVGNQDLGLTRMVNIILPLCCIEEQHQIVKEIENRISVADNLEITIDQSLKQSEALRQSILKRAFEGKLVPQDPNDEPAEVLLESIKHNQQ